MSGLSIAPYIMSLDDPGDMPAPKDGGLGTGHSVPALLPRKGRVKPRCVTFNAPSNCLKSTRAIGNSKMSTDSRFNHSGRLPAPASRLAWATIPEVILHLQQETRNMLLNKKLQQLAADGTQQGERTDLFESNKLNRGQRAHTNGIGRSKQRELNYLAGHAQTLLAAVQAGAVSTHAAYQEARGIPKETPLTTLHRVWRKVDPDNRLRFLVEMLTQQTSCAHARLRGRTAP